MPCWSPRVACRATSRQRSTSRRPEALEEAFHLMADAARDGAEIDRNGLDGGGFLARRVGCFAHARDLARRLERTPRRRFGAARNLLGGGALFRHCCRNGRRN